MSKANNEEIMKSNISEKKKWQKCTKENGAMRVMAAHRKASKLKSEALALAAIALGIMALMSANGENGENNGISWRAMAAVKMSERRQRVASGNLMAENDSDRMAVTINEE